MAPAEECTSVAIRFGVPAYAAVVPQDTPSTLGRQDPDNVRFSAWCEDMSMTCFCLIRVPVYSISSAISLYSSDAAFFVDALRDIYEVGLSSIARFVCSYPDRHSLSSEHRPRSHR